MESSNPAPRFPARPPIVPVIDIMGGRVVHAVGGRRSEYRPIESRLTDSDEPEAVARALVAVTGATWLYVADLDAIVHRRPDVPSLEAIARVGLPLMCDGGVRTPADATAFRGLDVATVVGTETGSLELISALGPSQCLLSLDLFDGRFVGDRARWGLRSPDDPITAASAAIELGVETVLVLDLARVGTGTGFGLTGLVTRIKSDFPEVHVLAGGGIRGSREMLALGSAGADGVLIASALHDGTLIPPRQAEPW